MLIIINVLFLFGFQFIAGWGLLCLFKITLKPWPSIALAFMVGTAFFSVVPFLLQLCYIPLTKTIVYSALLVSSLLVIVFQPVYCFAGLKKAISGLRFSLRIYEIPYMAVLLFLVFISVWRCYYFPPTSRDFTSGAEVIAKYALTEHTFVNSVFSVNLESTNNPFKPPYLMCLQLIYKQAGLVFGQVWLSALWISFLVFLYHILTERLHRIISGILLLFFVAIPEMYAYTVMVLFDYSNAVFFLLTIYFLIDYLKGAAPSTRKLWFTAILGGISCYIRSETLVLLAMITPLFLVHQWRAHRNPWKGMVSVIIFMIPPVIVYVLTISVYLNHYLPIKYDVSGILNNHLADISPFFNRITQMNNKLIFSRQGVSFWGCYFLLFLALLAADAVFRRKFSRESRNWLYAILVVYIGLAFLGYLLPLMDLMNTTKRGLFKIFPLMLLYFGNNGVLQSLSGWLTRLDTPDK
jgi:hypothetical protein